MRLARLLHSTVALIAAGHEFDPGVLNSIKAASDTILGGNRDATDAELLGLENLIDQLVPASADEGGKAHPDAQPSSVGGDEASGGEGGVPSPETSPPEGSELLPSGGEQPGVGSSEAGGDLSPSEPESVTAVAPPEASSEVPAEPVEQLTEVHAEPAGLAPADELFSPQSHDEDDGA